MNEKDELRFWGWVLRTDEESCWPWLGCCDHKGYGYFKIHGKMCRSHRLAYELVKGQIPGGLQIDHLCRNPACCNPNHLEAVTSRENTMRGDNITSIHAHQTHCIHGHPFTKENTYIYPDGERACRICRQKHQLDWGKKHNKKWGLKCAQPA